MLYSLILVIVFGYIFGYLFNKIKIPKLIGMIFIGIIFGYFSILSDSFLNISSYLRKVALIIILTRAGLSINLKKLKEIGISAFLMCFVPAVFEIVATVIFAPLLLPIDYLEALLLGTVLAAVSPAIIVPRMIKYKEQYKSNMPELLLAGSSLDDVFVITLFYSTLGFITNTSSNFVDVPLSIIFGIFIGVLIGLLLRKIFSVIKINSVIIMCITFSLSILLVHLENYFNFQSLISIIIIGLCLIKIKEIDNVKKTYNKLWIVFEIILFVLVGATVDLNIAFNYLFESLILFVILISFRSLGVLICIVKTKSTTNEKIFCIIGYLPKATVQASIGIVALSNGLEIGSLIYSIATLSIIVTAPLGAILLDFSTKKLLQK